MKAKDRKWEIDYQSLRIKCALEDIRLRRRIIKEAKARIAQLSMGKLKVRKDL